MTAELRYADSSVLRYLYVHGTRSAAVASWRHKSGASIPITRFGRVELTNAIAAAAFRGELSSQGRERAADALHSDIDSGALILTDLPWRAMLDRAAELSRIHTPALGVRSLDVLHVASAIEMGARQIVTFDEKQGRLARACGLRVVQP